MSFKYSQEVFHILISEAGVTAKIMCYLCSRMLPPLEG